MDTGLKLSIIAAMGKNDRAIGLNGKLPSWRLKNDLGRFVNLTKHHTLVVGRKTHDSILEKLGHPLKDRKTIVVSRQPNYRPGEGCILASSWPEALVGAWGQGEVFVIGGVEIYSLALPLTSKMYFTMVDGQFSADAFFPEFNLQDWGVVGDKLCGGDENNSHPHRFLDLERKSPLPIFVNLSNARDEEQKLVMANILARGICPFCPEHLPRFHKKPIIKESLRCILTENQWPYENTRVHLMIITKKHLEGLSDIDADTWREVLELAQWAEREYGIEGGGFNLRFGNTFVNGATVNHLHFQLATANITDKTDPNYKKVRFSISP
ncbi:HIT domain-containing protein [Candidatus Parcubacteria bacterium]|nr:MAG: HIT domain-containing protein [Candidatus Parcubacteria bacterium]